MNTLSTSDSELHSVLDFLAEEYSRAIDARNVELEKSGEQLIDKDKELSAIGAFCRFGRDLLNKHRPCSIRAADANYIIQLTNMKSFLLSPASPDQVKGAMQPCFAVPVTGYNRPDPSAGTVDMSAQRPMVNVAQ